MVKISVSILEKGEERLWDDYAAGHPEASVYHLSGWRRVLAEAYGLDTYYLLARRAEDDKSAGAGSGGIAGILPLVHLRHFLFGNHLISMPYVDLGGILADHRAAGDALLAEAEAIGRRLAAERIELRYAQPAVWHEPAVPSASGKVRMVVDLPGNSEHLWQSLKSKLKNQIRRPMKEGLKPKIGGGELLAPFYEVFARNMRDLGSPVHSRRLLEEVAGVFRDRARIIMIFKGQQPLAGALVIGFGKVLANPWASSNRQYSRMSPNMLLYWSMLEWGCQEGYHHCDLGRSTPGEGTYLFKRQWGAREIPLSWHWLKLRTNGKEGEAAPEKFRSAAGLWRRLPVPLSILLGPMIRKHIGL
jgi:serine/alanine adding enzyme